MVARVVNSSDGVCSLREVWFRQCEHASGSLVTLPPSQCPHWTLGPHFGGHWVSTTRSCIQYILRKSSYCQNDFYTIALDLDECRWNFNDKTAT